MSMMAAYLQGFIQTRRADYDRALQTELSSYNPQGIQRQILELQKARADILSGGSRGRSSNLEARQRQVAFQQAAANKRSDDATRRKAAETQETRITNIREETDQAVQDLPAEVNKFMATLRSDLFATKPTGLDNAAKDTIFTDLKAYYTNKWNKDDDLKGTPVEEYVKTQIKLQIEQAYKSSKTYFNKEIFGTYGVSNADIARMIVSEPLNTFGGEIHTIENGKRVPLKDVLVSKAKKQGSDRLTNERRISRTNLNVRPLDLEKDVNPILSYLQQTTEAEEDPKDSIAKIDKEIERLEEMLSEGPDLTRFQSRTPFGALSNVNIRETGLSTGLGRFLQKPTNIIQTFNDNRAARREAQQAQQDFKFDIELLESIADQAGDDNAIIDLEEQRKEQRKEYEADRRRREQNAREAEKTLAELEKRRKESGTSTNFNPVFGAATKTVASPLYPELEEANQFINLSEPPSSSNSSILSSEEARDINEKLDKEESDFGGASREFNLKRKRLINLLSSEDPEVSKIVSRSLLKFVPGQSVSGANVLERMKKNIIDTLSDKQKLKLATSTTAGATSTGEEKMTLSDPLVQILPGVDLEPVNEMFQDFEPLVDTKVTNYEKTYTTAPMDILELIEKDLREAGKDVPR